MRKLQFDTEQMVRVAHVGGSKALYSPKANSVRGVLDVVARSMDGFATSSVFEARLAREVLGGCLRRTGSAWRELRG